jgi:hypothetical protein
MPAVKSRVGRRVTVTEPGSSKPWQGIVIAEFRGLRRGSNVITRVEVTGTGSGYRAGSHVDIDTPYITYL